MSFRVLLCFFFYMQLYHLMPVTLSNIVTLGKTMVEDCGTIKIIATMCNELKDSLPLKWLLRRRWPGLWALAVSWVFKACLMHQDNDEIAISQSQSAVSLRVDGVKLASACNLFVIIRQLWKSQICCCLHEQKFTLSTYIQSPVRAPHRAEIEIKKFFHK